MKKKKAHKTKRKSKTPLSALVAPPPPVKAEDVPAKVEVTCPSCLTHFANAVIKFGERVRPEHFSIRNDLKDIVKFQKSGLPICTCGFKFTPLAIYSMMMSATARSKMERNIWGTQYREAQGPGSSGTDF